MLAWGPKLRFTEAVDVLPVKSISFCFAPTVRPPKALHVLDHANRVARIARICRLELFKDLGWGTAPELWEDGEEVYYMENDEEKVIVGEVVYK